MDRRYHWPTILSILKKWEDEGYVLGTVCWHQNCCNTWEDQMILVDIKHNMHVTVSNDNVSLKQCKTLDGIKKVCLSKGYLYRRPDKTSWDKLGQTEREFLRMYEEALSVFGDSKSETKNHDDTEFDWDKIDAAMRGFDKGNNMIVGSFFYHTHCLNYTDPWLFYDLDSFKMPIIERTSHTECKSELELQKSCLSEGKIYKKHDKTNWDIMTPQQQRFVILYENHQNQQNSRK